LALHGKEERGVIFQAVSDTQFNKYPISRADPSEYFLDDSILAVLRTHSCTVSE
jgi:hypothetical protein